MARPQGSGHDALRSRVFRQVVSIEVFLVVPPKIDLEGRDPEGVLGLLDAEAYVRDAVNGACPSEPLNRCDVTAGESFVGTPEELTP